MATRIPTLLHRTSNPTLRGPRGILASIHSDCRENRDLVPHLRNTEPSLRMYSRVYFDAENYSLLVDTKSAPDGPKYGDRFVVHPLKVSADEEAWTIANVDEYDTRLGNPSGINSAPSLLH